MTRTVADEHVGEMADDARLARRVIGIATALRLLAAAALPLGVDESYATVVARALSLSYFDHPPASFWLAHAAAALAGESPLALRWPFVLLFALTSWLLFRLGARLFGTRAGLWTVVAAQMAPVFSLSSGSWVLPDGPLLCASVATALLLAQVTDVGTTDDATPSARNGRNAWRRWLAIGLALGAAGLSKYHAALLGLGALAFVLSDPRSRAWLRHPAPYVAVLTALACVAPVFVWNAQHDWASFRFQSGRASGDGNPLVSLLQNLAGQAGYLLPWIWGPLVVVLLRALRTGPRDRATWFCCCLGAPPVIVFTLAALGGRPGLPHWPAPGYLLLLPLLGAAMMRWEVRAPAVMHRRTAIGTGVFTVLVTIVVTHTATGWVARVVPSLHHNDPAFELVEYRSLVDSVHATGLDAGASFVATSDWIRAAKVGYALGPALPVLVLNDDARHFAFLPTRVALVGRDGLVFVTMRRGETAATVQERATALASHFDALRFERLLPVMRGADTAAMLGLFTGRGLHQLPRRP